MVKQGVILASGLGSRLNKDGKNEPKPLMPIGGIPLIQRVITLMKKAGIEKIVLVLGYRSDQIEKFIKENNFSNIITVNNPEYNKKNGISLLKAKEAVDLEEPFLLSMADHIFSNDYFAEFIERASQIYDNADAVLSVDRDIESVFDLDDATKVFIKDDSISKIGKELKAYNAIDTGLFLCKPSIFDELEKIYTENGDVSVSEGMKALSKRKKFLPVDMTGFLWQDVDTPAMKYEAEQRLIDNFISSSDEKFFFSNSIIDKISKELLLAAFKRESFQWSLITPLFLIIAIFLGSFSISSGIMWPSLIVYLLAVLIENIFKIRDFVGLVPENKKDFFSFPLNASVAMIPVIYNTHPLVAIIISVAIFLLIFAPFGGYTDTISSQTPDLSRSLLNTYFSFSFSFFALTLLIILPLPSIVISLIFLFYLTIIIGNNVNGIKK